MSGDRVSVQTYVPAGQRDRWREEADELDMSQAEYVRTMVQAGRRGFDLADGGDEPASPDATPGVDGLKDRVLAVLEERLDETLGELQDENRVLHSGRQGGYTVVEDGR